MQSPVRESDWQEVCHNNMPVLWITHCWRTSLTVCACVLALTITPSSVSSNLSDRHPGSRSGLQRRAGGRAWACDGRPGARVHQAWLPSDAGEAGLKWVGVMSRIASWGQAGGRVGRVTLMHPGSVGFFHHTHGVHTQEHTHKHMRLFSTLLLRLNYTLTCRPHSGSAEKL